MMRKPILTMGYVCCLGWELSFMLRTGRAEEVMSEKVDRFRSDRLLFPIPQRAIDVNPDLEQNSGY